MIFDFDELNPAAWFDFPNDPGKGRVQVRVCAGEDLERITKETTHPKVEYKKHQRFEYEKVDDNQQEKLWDFCIVDWENFFDAKKKPVPCDIKNKVKLMKGSVIFATFIGDCLEQITNDIQIQKEVAEKNSKSSPSDS